MSSIVSINNESVSYNKKDDLNVSSNSSSSSSLANPITESSPKSLAPIESLKLQESNKNCIDELEFNFQEKFKETNREIENVSHEMTSLSSFIAEARQKYENLKNQYRFQLDTLIKLNEEIRNDMHQIESRNEHLKAENLKLKAENKQFYGEFVIISKELDEQYCNGVEDMNLEEIERQMGRLKSDIAKLILSNQTLNKQLSLSSENIKYLQKINFQNRQANNNQDQMVIIQSLESELERERKVRIVIETDKQELLNQLKTIKDKSQKIINSLKHLNEQNDVDLKKQRDLNSELSNKIQVLKSEAKNNAAIQEDLVRLVQKLQIDLIEIKMSNEDQQDANKRNIREESNEAQRHLIKITCQHEDDISQCSSCETLFNTSKRKYRCMHCCKIFCADCSSRTINIGPNLRPHRVCDSCHTLLIYCN